MVKGVFLIDLFEANDNLVGGVVDGMNRLLPYIRGGACYQDIPVLFYVAQSREALDYLGKNNADFLQRHAITGDSLLHQAVLEESEDLFRQILVLFQSKGALDVQNHSGITALSAALKFGRVQRAHELILSGCDMKLPAEGGLTPARQAILCIEGEHCAVAGLSLLLDSGLALDEAELENLHHSAKMLNRNLLAEFISSVSC